MVSNKSKKRIIVVTGLAVIATVLLIIGIVASCRKKVIKYNKINLLRKPLRYAFVYVGKLRTWEKSIPTWHHIFSKYKPDVFLFLNPEPDKQDLALEDYKRVFGPDVNIKLIHYWGEDDRKTFDEAIAKRAPMMLEFVRGDDLKDIEILQNETSDFPGRCNMFMQFYQLQKAFEMYDFRKDYDIVVKSRMDVVPKNNFNINPPWSDVPTVIPHMETLWKENPNFKDFHVEGRVESYHKFGEGYTLGGAFVHNPKSYYRKVNKKKVIWMLNDFVYWGSAVNMQKLHSDIFEKYGLYLNKKIPYSWCPEGNLILHTKAHKLQPLMVMKCIDIIRN